MNLKSTLRDDSEDYSDAEVDEEIDSNELTAYDIAVFYNTYNLSTLLKWWGKKLIIPEYQRAYVWTQKKASEFVDSMLRGLPVPSIFFYDDIDNSQLLVVDGQQRLNSLYKFIITKEYDGKPFKLIGNIHPKWKGLSFDDLEETDRDKLLDALINITVMRQLVPDEGQSAMYLVFQRVNTGGISLNAQEIRMALSYGSLSIYLDELSKDKRFDKWDFLRTKAQVKNGNYSPIQEMILKFWAYYFSYPNFSGSSTRALLDSFFDNQKEFDNPKRPKQDISYISKDEFETAFNASFEELNTLTRDDLSPYKKPTKTFLEAVWVGLTYRKLKLDKPINVKTLPDYLRNWKNVIGEEEFEKLFQARRTSSISSAKERIEAAINYLAGDF